MAESVRKQMVRRCRLAIGRIQSTEETLCQIDGMHEGRSDAIKAMVPVILRATEILVDLWEKMRANI